MRIYAQFLSLCFIISISSCKTSTSEDRVEVNTSTNYEPEIDIIPISHATFVLQWDEVTFYIDPTGGAQSYQNLPQEDVILITDIHGDHLDIETLGLVRGEQSILIVPEAVNEKIKTEQRGAEVLHNGQSTSFNGFKVIAVPMYNLTDQRLKFHKKGRGNGYVIEKNGYRVYISGDTEDIPEMRKLQDINVAFICMNLPYTMTAEQAANAVIDFKPDLVYPYHYRGASGFEDILLFKKRIDSAQIGTEVVMLDWYPEE